MEAQIDTRQVSKLGEQENISATNGYMLAPHVMLSGIRQIGSEWSPANVEEGEVCKRGESYKRVCVWVEENKGKMLWSL